MPKVTQGRYRHIIIELTEKEARQMLKDIGYAGQPKVLYRKIGEGIREFIPLEDDLHNF